MTKDECKQVVLDIIADIAPDEDLSNVKPDVRLRDQLELDSMDFLDIVMELRKRTFALARPEDIKGSNLNLHLREAKIAGTKGKLGSLAVTQLDPAQFVRVHRSTIVNVDRIQELRSSFNGEYVIYLHDKTRLTLSRGYRDGLQGRLGKTL